MSVKIFEYQLINFKMHCCHDNFEMIFDILGFFKKTNERIHFFWPNSIKNEFVCSFFGRIRGYQKVVSKLSDLWSNFRFLKNCVFIFWDLGAQFVSSNHNILRANITIHCIVGYFIYNFKSMNIWSLSL